MAINFSSTGAGSQYNAFNAVSTDAIAMAQDDIVVLIAVFTDNNPAGNLTVTNSGSAMTDLGGGVRWKPIENVGTPGCRIAAWWGRSPNAESRMMTVAWDSGNGLTWGLFTIKHSDAHLTDAAPAANVFKGNSSAGVSRSITPQKAGSALWLLAADYDAVSVQTITPGTGCVVEQQLVTDQWAAALIRPQTQPRADGSAFTLSETHSGGATVSWLAFEIQAAGAAAVAAKRMALLGVG